MPLFCAAQWIASKGGAVEIEAEHSEAWGAAFSDLVAHIASREVTVTGERSGEREVIPGHIFGALEIGYPFGAAALDLTLSDALHLCSYPYLDEEHWHRRFNDSLRSRAGIKWSKLMVPKSEVARLWPFASDFVQSVVSSGAPGRPTSMHLIEAEYRARRDRGECNDSIGEEAAALAVWLARSHSEAPRLKPKTIANRLRSEFRDDQVRAPK